ncbi:late embryogenesis abundant protein 2 [Arachis ipaensis]|uniref:late embryogenesis abundant protein 2 n=1 Tax=Arachis ipaensis TaxID=130454 RepID=UPI0007AF5687|nr:late embryogenesis abundant protein 2 [Arachis ipaensis]XP_029151305.1 late embryogenesis abundant protein 2 [Arachis hypogaea]
MASHDQSFKAGEAKGQTQEKTNQMMRNIGDKAQSAKDKTAQTAQAAKDKTQQAAQAAKERTTGDNVKIFVNGDTCGSLTGICVNNCVSK